MGDFDSSPLSAMLLGSALLPDTADLFDLYYDTLSTLLDRHAPFRTKRLSTRRAEPWFDQECRQFRRSTRQSEQAYRLDRSVSSLAEWRSHFQEQRRVFRRNSEIYWSTAIADCHGDPKKLWSAVNRLLQPVTSSTAQHAAADLAAHFTTKV